jgi:hypothetical protein
MNDFSLSDVAVLPSPPGYRLIALFTVRTNLLVFSNTTSHRMELRYDRAGEVVGKGTLEDISEYGFKLGFCSPAASANVPGAEKLDRKAEPQSQCPRCRSRQVVLQGL